MTKKEDLSEKRLPPLLRRSWFNLNKSFRRRIAHLNLTPDQFTTMRWISEKSEQGLIQRDLVDLMSSDPNTIVSILKRLQAAELVERKQMPHDKRVYQLSLTEKGHQLMEQALPYAIELQNEVLSHLSEKQQMELIKSLNIIAKATKSII